MKKHLPMIVAIFILVLVVVIFVFIFKRGIGTIPDPEMTSTEQSDTFESMHLSPTATITASRSPSPTPSSILQNTPVDATSSSDESNPDYRQAMREWVILINTIAKKYNDNFFLVPQNCAPLFTESGKSNGEISLEFISAIDGTGVEGISYGNEKYDKARDEESKDILVGLLNIGVKNGITVLAVDYCNSGKKIEDALELDARYGYLGYIADTYELTNIPEEPMSVNENDIWSLSDAENWLYLLNPGKFRSKEAFIQAMSETDYDVLVIDAFFDTDEMLSAEDVARLKVKNNGAQRLVIAYLSIGEAEDYRYYWQESYDKNPPEWMLAENSNWEGNYPVKYWNAQWQEIIATGENSYLTQIINSGFDGAYLDIVDGYETFEDMEE